VLYRLLKDINGFLNFLYGSWDMTFGGDAGVVIRGLTEIVVSKRWRERDEMKTPQERPAANMKPSKALP
jgi:hypothetical protein